MNENSVVPKNERSIWVRGLLMLLMGFAFQASGTVICIVTVIQFVMTLLNDTPNERLVAFGRSLGRYLQQIINFLTFATEETPFPFGDWPAGD